MLKFCFESHVSPLVIWFAKYDPKGFEIIKHIQKCLFILFFFVTNLQISRWAQYLCFVVQPKHWILNFSYHVCLSWKSCKSHIIILLKVCTMLVHTHLTESHPVHSSGCCFVLPGYECCVYTPRIKSGITICNFVCFRYYTLWITFFTIFVF